MSTSPSPEEVARIAAMAVRLTDYHRRTLSTAEALADGRVLVPAYSVPDHLTTPYSVHRSALNRAGLALRHHLIAMEEKG